MIDIIGDIHGHADKLEQLLQQLGYENVNNVYQHLTENRTVLFIGDYIDKGPKIKETLEIVKAMVDFGSAKALMGNHEYNAILYHTKDSNGNYLRKHSDSNTFQHSETIKAFEHNPSELDAYIEWFKTLPLFYETDHFRAVHAAWEYDKIDYLKNRLVNNCITNEMLIEAADKTTELYDAIEITLKGKELKLPNGLSFIDNYNKERSEIRIKWWVNATENNYKTIAIHTLDSIPEIALTETETYYLPNDKPVFFGHYWLEGEPKIYQNNICCVDYSVAKDGKLVSYTYNNEEKLNNSNFTFV
jgi:hypothetical protein